MVGVVDFGNDLMTSTNRYANVCRFLAATVLVALVASASTGPIRAQDDEAAPEKAAPSKPGAKPQGKKPPAIPVLEDRTVEAVLDTKPTTPSECARAAKILADLDRPDLARSFLQRVLKAKLDESQMAAMVEEFGSAMFLEMAGRKELQPEARQLSEALLAAANRKLQDPKRLAELIRQLQDPADHMRVRALAGLRDARSAAVGPLLAVLADPARSADHPYARSALAHLGSNAEGPLLAVLEDGRPELKAQAVEVLVQLNVRRAAHLLLAPCVSEKTDPKFRAAAAAGLLRLIGQLPSRAEAVALLAEQARLYLDGRQPLPRVVDGRIEHWQWDDAKQQYSSRMVPVDDASRMLAARLARDAYSLAPDDRQVRLLHATAMLEDAAFRNGRDKPLDFKENPAAREAAAFEAYFLEAVLESASAGAHPAAATAAARILGEIGQPETLLYRGPGPAPLARALEHPDSRLRLAAAEAVVRLKPDKPFSGSSNLLQALAFAAGTSGSRRAIVAGRGAETSRTLASSLAGMGLQAETAATGRDACRLARSSPDIELALIDPAIQQPVAAELLQQLRLDWRTAMLPVALIAPANWLAQAERIAREHPRTIAFPRPHDDRAFRWQMQQLASLAPYESVPHAERRQQAAKALDLLAELSRSAPRGLYDLRQVQAEVLTALAVPPLTARAAFVLGKMGTRDSQRALVDLASRQTQPAVTRKAAAAAFHRSTIEHGILLTTAEIRRQYDRYNASASADTDTQQVLGAVLDSIESPSQANKKGR